MSLQDNFVNYSYNKKDIKNLQVKDNKDLEYMNSLSSAMLMRTPIRTKIMLWVSFFVIVWLIVWAYYANIDALTRGQGRVIPSSQVQVVQNLEGGIVSEILVKEGDKVKKGEILIRIDDTDFNSIYMESKLKYNELQAKSIRLLAELSGKPFTVSKKIEEKSPNLIQHEFSLYKTNKAQLENSIAIYKHRFAQKRNELEEAKSKLAQLTHNYNLISKEVNLNRPLVKSGIVSEVEFLQLQRKASSVNGDMRATELSIPRLISVIEEQKDNIKEVKLKFQNKAKEDYNKIKAQMYRIKEANVARADKVRRTFVRSPVDGTITQLLVNTIGEVVKPGMNIVKIVPTQDNLIIETRIKPKDIAFLYPGQRAIVKFSAYNFTIYGSLKGKVTNISADTIVNKVDRKNYYIVRIKTNKNYLGKGKKKHYIKVGMTASVDIVTGKRTVLQYILKPILRAKESLLSNS